MEQAYAQALWQLLEKDWEPKKALHALVASLRERGREALLPRIARAFERLAEREMRKQRILVTVARKRDANDAKRDARTIIDQLGADAKNMQIAFDESLIGGWRLEGAGLLVDTSFKKSLLEMYNHATS